jgi:hypothetical protein
MLPMLPADKANHVLYGGVIFIMVAYLAAMIWHSTARARLAGLLAAAAFGLGKEARDWFATAAGGALCWLATMAVQG